MAFWMGVASAEHARGGRDGGFAQLGHGKHMAVKSLSKGDWIVYYSPREGMGEGETVQAFTTIGRVTSDAPAGPSKRWTSIRIASMWTT
jgi:hypothetical protein